VVLAPLAPALFSSGVRFFMGQDDHAGPRFFHGRPRFFHGKPPRLTESLQCVNIVIPLYLVQVVQVVQAVCKQCA